MDKRWRRPCLRSRHDDGHTRSSSKPHQQGTDARSGESGEADHGLRSVVWQAAWRHFEVRRSGISQFEGEEMSGVLRPASPGAPGEAGRKCDLFRSTGFRPWLRLCRRSTALRGLFVVLMTIGCTAPADAQRGQPAGPPPTAKAAAPIDLTGYWTAVITEDWHTRMLTAPKGDFGTGAAGAVALPGETPIGTGSN